MHLYLLLIKNHWHFFWRSVKRKHRWLTIIAVSMVLIYLTFVLVGMGIFFKEVLTGSQAGDDPIGFINRYLLEIFIGLFSLRFFLQQGPKVTFHAIWSTF
ncbi:MAG: DUF5687 family protein [Bacteroidota bacterium]